MLRGARSPAVFQLYGPPPSVFVNRSISSLDMRYWLPIFMAANFFALIISRTLVMPMPSISAVSAIECSRLGGFWPCCTMSCIVSKHSTNHGHGAIARNV